MWLVFAALLTLNAVLRANFDIIDARTLKAKVRFIVLHAFVLCVCRLNTSKSVFIRVANSRFPPLNRCCRRCIPRPRSSPSSFRSATTVTNRLLLWFLVAFFGSAEHS